MRMAFFHNHPSGGAARAIYELGKELAPRHQIDVFNLTSADEQLFPSRDYAQSVRSFPFAERPAIRMGLYLNEWRRYSDLNRLERVYRSAAAAIDAGGYDVVLVNACRFLQAPSVLRYLVTPTVYYCHEPPRRFVQAACRADAGPLTLYQRLRASWHAPARKLLDGVLARRDRANFAAATAVVTNSHFTASLVQRHYDREAQVCRLGVDTAALQPGTSSHRNYVLSVGALEPHKGFDFVVRSVGLLPETSRPELVIVANYVNPGVESDLRRLAASHAVELRLAVGVTHQELVSLYQGARVFAYAPHEEPFGLAALEAMACGLPVVAVAEGGVIESVRQSENGLLTARRETDFAEALAQVLSDDALARELGESGRRLATAEWSWKAASQRLEAHLRETAAAVPRTVASAAPPPQAAQEAGRS